VKLPAGIETKVGASAGIGGVVSLVFGLAAYYKWFTPPPPYLSGGIVAAVSAVAAWLAPHTSRLKPLTPEQNATLSDADRDRAEKMRLALAPGTPSFYPYPGETVSHTGSTVTYENPPGQPPADPTLPRHQRRESP